VVGGDCSWIRLLTSTQIKKDRDDFKHQTERDFERSSSLSARSVVSFTSSEYFACVEWNHRSAEGDIHPRTAG
jgi:hypothetical protein